MHTCAAMVQYVNESCATHNESLTKRRDSPVINVHRAELKNHSVMKKGRKSECQEKAHGDELPFACWLLA